MDVYKRKDFARWQMSENLADCMLCQAVEEMNSGLVDASLGGLLFKKRVSTEHGGKRGGYRTLLSARVGKRYVFLHGFRKSDKADITPSEQKALQFAGKVFLELSPQALAKALGCGVLMEVHCDQQTD
ncbi:type II toxin-antitoxin system RelE/ParE family toxin [Pseudomonas sp. NPDC089406]|uniref:type II toxin-antitoxin system RelE/ParE family toxin n=1 Tax=Pseudomonas sp. NPDC089406 TaxID=3364463 RepID=UPI00385034C6